MNYKLIFKTFCGATNVKNLLVSIVSWIVHLLIVNRLRLLAEMFPMHEIRLIGMLVAVENNLFDLKLGKIYRLQPKLTSFLNSPFFLRKFDTTTCNSSACFS